MQTTSYLANGIASFSAFIGLCSAVVAVLSYRKSVSQYELNKCDNLFKRCSTNLDDSYLAINDFISNYSNARESRTKRIARDKVVYLLEAMLKEIESSKYLSIEYKKRYGDLGMSISDITFESNIEKISRDLSYIKNEIMSLKKQLFNNPE